MRKYLLHVLIISFVFLLTPTAQAASYEDEKRIEYAKEVVRNNPDDADDSLDTMLDMVMEKENQAKRLEELRRKREEEEQKRLAEIERLKNEQARKRTEAIIEDVRKYKRIVSSEYGKDMKEAAWGNLVNRHPEVSGLSVGDINGIRKLYPTVLRPSYKTLSVSQVQSMPNMSIRKKEKWGFYGHSTIKHNYNLRSISGDKVVVDNATGLMWHQGGSDDFIGWNEAKDWVRSLNSRGYAGYQDWRLPTLEEAASLLESNKRNDLYIDPVFSKKQRYIWTGDSKAGSEAAWGVGFNDGGVSWGDRIFSYVRPVRSVE